MENKYFFLQINLLVSSPDRSRK